MLAKRVALGKRNQITLPAEFIPKGTDQFRVQRRPDGAIELIPLASIPASQMYFWTDRWQKGEVRAADDIAAGRTRAFKSPNALFEAIDKRRGR